MFEKFKCYSHSFVVRKHNGEFVKARSKCSHGQIARELAEAIDIREALSWVNTKMEGDVEIETNCLPTV